MTRSVFGWDLPPGCTTRDIDRAYGFDEEAKWEAIMDDFFKESRFSKTAWQLSDKLYKGNKSGDIDELITKAIQFGIELNHKQEIENNAENKFYENEYHELKRNPKLRAFFKKQRQSIKELTEYRNYVAQCLTENNGIYKP